MKRLTAQQHLELSFAITDVLAESTDPQSAVNEILARIGNAFAFDAGSFWVVHEVRATLRCATFWTKEGLSFPNFELVSRVRDLSMGRGLPGRSWETRRPVFLPDLAVTPRATVAQLDGLRSGVAFPAFRLRRVFGVFEFFSRGKDAPEEDALSFFAALGVQIGVFLEHYGINEHVVEDQGEVRLAAERSLDAVLTINVGSTVLYANSAVFHVFGWQPNELIGQKLTKIIPEHLRNRHKEGIRRYSTTGERRLDWTAIQLPALHKNGHEILVSLEFGEFWRKGSRVFTGFARLVPPQILPFVKKRTKRKPSV